MNDAIPGLDPELTEAIISTLREPILILDGSLRVVLGNKAFYNTFDVEYEEVRGKLIYELGSGEWEIPSLHALLEQIIPQKTIVEGYEVKHEFGKLGMRVMVVNAKTIPFNNRPSNILFSISDVTDQRTIQQTNERLMLQKDTLLKEMRHRIANSLQLIASVILLKAGSVTSEESRAHLEDAHDRILSIATVQRNLEPSSEGSMVPVRDYLYILCSSITKSMIGGRKPITIKVTGGEGSVTPDEAIGLGLITTELVMNALKHAFPTGEGQITVSFESEGAHWKLSVGDDGVGLRSSPSPHIDGLGTSIIESLSVQLNAKVERTTSSRGTVVSIST